MPGLVPISVLLVAQMSIAGIAAAETRGHIEVSATMPQSEELSQLVETLDHWLDEHTDFPRVPRPRIELISPEEAADLSHAAGHRHDGLRGLFDPDRSTIYLVQPWRPEDPHDVGVLLHELVHARQVNQHYYCPGAQEEAAYRLQDQWLSQQGLQANINWIAVVLEAGCTLRDIHPD